jgi:hypothetical protein
MSRTSGTAIAEPFEPVQVAFAVDEKAVASAEDEEAAEDQEGRAGDAALGMENRTVCPLRHYDQNASRPLARLPPRTIRRPWYSCPWHYYLLA